jgi:phosphoribosyl 1,2-cyclic phosphodiesterase
VRFSSLGSGSQGNALIIEAGTTRLMLDCGFPVRETVARLARIGITPEQLSGILVTHEHGDHGDGVFPFARRFGTPVWMTHGSFAALRAGEREAGRSVRVHLLDADTAFAVGDLQVLPFTVPHDAREPVQYVLSDGVRRLGVLTDTGCSTPHIESTLSGCDALVLECNHDVELLRNGPYRASLKARIGGRFGHLANVVSSRILGALDQSRLKHVIAAHLSEQNNKPELARAALAAAMNCEPGWIGVATQAEGFDWRSLD